MLFLDRNQSGDIPLKGCNAPTLLSGCKVTVLRIKISYFLKNSCK